jgi:hypothetical protein
VLLGCRGPALPSEQERSIYNLDAAYAIACRQLAKVDIEEQCRRSGAQYQVKDSQKAITIRYLNQPYLITFPDIDVSFIDGVEKVPLREKILILHYFIQAKGTPASNKLITFRDLPGGNIYYPTFTKRTMKPLSDNFGKEPSLLARVCEKVGGRKADYGDIGITIDAFDRVPITLVLWQGDEEFPPQLNLLFDSNITDYLESEDVTVLCETLAWRLIGFLREG